MTYNLTTVEDSSTFFDFIKAISNLNSTESVTTPVFNYGLLIVMGTVIVTFFLMKRYDTKVSSVVSTFVGLIISMIFLALEMVNIAIVWTCLALFIGALLIMIFVEDK